MKRIVVMGSTGMAGHVISLYLEEHGYDIYRTSRSEKVGEKSAAFNVSDFPALECWLDSVKPEVVVNCIGLLQRDAQEHPDKAIWLNSYLPKYLESKYKKTSTKLVHLSTDCVFSGSRGRYEENDLPDGSTIYDRTKAFGEVNNDKDLTFRMSIIGPDVDFEGTGLFNWFMKQSGSISGYGKAIWNGVTTIELARGIDAAIKQNLCGLYHLVPEKHIDKYNLLLLFQKSFSKSDIEICYKDNVVLDKSLVNTRTDFNFLVKEYPEQIEDMKAWIEAHWHLYPTYK